MPSTPTEPDEYLVGRVQEVLAHDPRVNELDVTVTITGTGVFLDGMVPTEERRDAITEVVGEVLRGHDVHNQVTVAPLTEPEGAEELS